MINGEAAAEEDLVLGGESSRTVKAQPRSLVPRLLALFSYFFPFNLIVLHYTSEL